MSLLFALGMPVAVTLVVLLIWDLCQAGIMAHRVLACFFTGHRPWVMRQFGLNGSQFESSGWAGPVASLQNRGEPWYDLTFCRRCGLVYATERKP